MSRCTLHLGDCLEILRALPDDSVDAIVTDPPYGLTNDGGGPGGKGLDTPFARAKAGASTGGFMGLKWDSDVPSVEVWAECLRVLKPGGYLLAFAGTRTQHRMATRIEDAGFEIRDLIAWVYGSGFPKSHNGDWGGTALKPALEPITVARKPLIGTVEANWREHGTGALNIDGTRLECSRWPANLIHDGSEEVLAAFPDSNGSGSARMLKRGQRQDGEGWGMADQPGTLRDAGTGSAARFFYCAKASRADRNEGLEDPGPQFKKGSTLRDAERLNAAGERKGNHHPTVKPTDLMRYLCRLVTPPGGLVLDPFMGSGSTGKACMLEGFRFIGCELSPEYLAIAEDRIAAAIASTEQPEPAPQLDLFAEVAA